VRATAPRSELPLPGGADSPPAIAIAARPRRPASPPHRSQPDQALLQRLENRLAARVDLELAVDALDMTGHRLFGKAEMFRDLGVAEPLGDAPEDVDLARRQFRRAERGNGGARALRAPHDEARDRGRNR